MTQATRPPAAKQHTLIAGRKLGKGEFSVDIPRDLVTRHGPYKVLSPSEALLLAGICSLRPGKYFSKSRLFKAAGMDINQGRNVLARLVEKGFILEAGHSWMPLIPERDEQPKAEQPTAKKEGKEEASPEQPQQPQSARKVDRPVKVKRGDDLPANALVNQFVDAWNQNVKIGKQGVDAGGFQPHVTEYINTFCSKYELDPIEFVSEAARCLHWYTDGRYEGATPSFVFNSKGVEYHRSLFQSQINAINQRRYKQLVTEKKDAAYNAILRAAEEQGVKAPTRERMELGWSNDNYAHLHYVALDFNDIEMGIWTIVHRGKGHETREGLTSLYKTSSPTYEQRHQRDCELIEKVFYAAASIVGADRISDFNVKSEFNSFVLLKEAAGIK